MVAVSAVSMTVSVTTAVSTVAVSTMTVSITATKKQGNLVSCSSQSQLLILPISSMMMVMVSVTVSSISASIATSITAISTETINQRSVPLTSTGHSPGVPLLTLGSRIHRILRGHHIRIQRRSPSPLRSQRLRCLRCQSGDWNRPARSQPPTRREPTVRDTDHMRSWTHTPCLCPLAQSSSGTLT